MAKEMRRTCKRDGTVWYVPLKLAKKVSFGERMIESGNRMQAAGQSVKLIGRPSGAPASNADRLADSFARRTGAARCPECGSSSFVEKKVRV